ncbi:hypothetical protein AB0M45_31680 [Nocardia sp. NPDC051787]|uniref:hypothetical protein n=1 Tax=Nocardia sp. NPDC051787 TaxID=3155415 RepID=UPI00344A1811
MTDKQWKLLELLLPKSERRLGRNFANYRLVAIATACIYRGPMQRADRSVPADISWADRTQPALEKQSYLRTSITVQ